MIGIVVFFGVGILTGIIFTTYGIYLAKKSSYKNLDAIIVSFVGAGIINAVSAITAILLNHVTF